jgi:hypothetical protein
LDSAAKQRHRLALQRGDNASDALFRRAAQILRADLDAYRIRHSGPLVASDRLALQQIVTKAIAQVYGYTQGTGPLYQVMVRECHNAFVMEASAQMEAARAELNQSVTGRAIVAILDGTGD